MTYQEIEEIYGSVVNALDFSELKMAFDLLESFVSSTRLGRFQDKLTEMTETYKRLLHYYVAGSKDPMQSKILHELFASAYQLADEVRDAAFIQDNPQLYYATKRTFALLPVHIGTLLKAVWNAYQVDDFVTAESYVNQLFKFIWTVDSLTDDDLADIRGAFKQGAAGHAATVVNSQIVSALILALQHSFDRKKMLLLFDAAENAHEEVKLRAYVGLLLLLYAYRKRMECYPEVSLRLAALADSPDFKTLLYLIVKRFILSRDTERISHKMKDEFIPEMMKLAPKFNPHVSWKDFSLDNFEAGMNPEWMEKFSKGKLGKTLEEFNELQEEGADVMHSTFVHLKGFPFFQEIANWFLPFTRMHSALKGNEMLTDSFGIITQSGLMCDSDLYSLFFSMSSIPEVGRKLMLGQLEEQMNAYRQQRSEMERTQNDRAERIIGQYVQDLYRFYKLFPRRNEFLDVFTQKLDFHNLPMIQPYLTSQDDYMKIAEYYLRKNHFEDALTIYTKMPDEEVLLQKRGYCRQMTGDHAGALEDYLNAEFLNSDSKWLLRHIAQCYRMVKMPERAVEYYRRCEKLDPDNLSVALSIGSCYLEMDEYGEALKYYFKVDYSDPEGGKAWRPIAWCSFLTGRYGQARKYYRKIVALEPDSQDFMNAGHTEWVLQNLQGALDYYKESLEALNHDFTEFRQQFDADVPALQDAGIDQSEIRLMMDGLRYMA